MMAGSYCYALPIKHGCNVVRVNIMEIERKNAATLLNWWPVQGQPVNIL
jgi:hypothetical protein